MKQRFSKEERERLSEMTRALYEQFYVPTMKKIPRAQREESAILAVIRELEACQEKNEKK